MGVASCCGQQPKTSTEAIPGKDNCITAVVVSARGLRDAETFPVRDCYFYCTIGIMGKSGYIYKTRPVKDTLRPTWKEECLIGPPQFTPGDDLNFSVFESDADGTGSIVASAMLRALSFEKQGFHGDLQLEHGGERLAAYLRMKLKLPAQPYPEGPLDEFTIVLDNPIRQPIGMEFDAQDGCTVYVRGIKPGLLAAYNEGADPNRRVQPGDFIMRVNDIEGKSAQLLEAMKQESCLELLIRRPVEIFVALSGDPDGDLDGDPKPHRAPPSKGRGVGCMPRCGHEEPSNQMHFGMEFAKNLVGESLMITAIMDGPIEDWNAENPDQAVRSGDRIVAVNGKKGKAVDLLKEMRAMDSFTMSIVRPGDTKEDDEDFALN